MDIQTLISKLNDEQKKPVLETEGAVLVIAGAGSGKTRVLTTRIAYLVLEKGVSPSNILAITFTNKATKEMKERLSKIIPNSEEMWVSTIHGMCSRILSKDIDKLGYNKNFTIYDDSDKEKALKRVFQDLNIDERLFKQAKNMISDAKNDCLSPEEFKSVNKNIRFINEFTQIYSAYEEQLALSNALDFDDLLYKTYQLFTNFPDVAKYYSNKFKYIHIDEFQDTNTVQFAIARKLSSVWGNLFVVGDDDQSIYSWRGAKIENILSFDDKYSGAKVFKLERNYRSTKNILNLANTIIANNTSRREKELWTDNGEGVKVESFVGTDENNEAAYVAMQIKSLIDRSNYKYKDFAVFMRLNALSRAFEQEFTKYAIPYKVYGGFRFFERKEIKDILSYLKLIVNPNDNEAFLRSITTPKRGIGEKSLKELREFAVAENLSLFDASDRLEGSSISGSARLKIYNYKKLILSFIDYSKTHTAVETIDYVLSVTEFMSQYAEKTDENRERILNISELKNSAEQFLKDNVGTDLADYLTSVTLSSDTDDINNDDCVTIATIHASKGLEFRCVFVAGLDENILPVLRDKDDDEIEEERRLMYVAVTRAKERLYLTRAMSRFMYGGRERMRPSRFLREGQMALGIKEQPKVNNSIYDERPNYYNNNSNSNFKQGFGNNFEDNYYVPTSNIGYSSSYAKKMLNENKPKVNSKNNSSSFNRGMKVKHAKFGEGLVIDVKGSGENLIVDVAFKGIGVKSLAVKYAPLEII